MRSALEADNSLFARTLPARLESLITNIMGLFDFFRLAPKQKPAVQKLLAGLNPLLGQMIKDVSGILGSKFYFPNAYGRQTDKYLSIE